MLTPSDDPTSAEGQTFHSDPNWLRVGADARARRDQPQARRPGSGPCQRLSCRAAESGRLQGDDAVATLPTGHSHRSDLGQGAARVDLELVNDPVPAGLDVEELTIG